MKAFLFPFVYEGNYLEMGLSRIEIELKIISKAGLTCNRGSNANVC